LISRTSPADHYGLDDTIGQYNPKTGDGNGFKFGPYKPAAFIEAIQNAVDLFQDAKAWKKLVANGMRADFSWDRSAKSYLALYRSVIEMRTSEIGKIGGSSPSTAKANREGRSLKGER